jgi:hypothetical protein
MGVVVPQNFEERKTDIRVRFAGARLCSGLTSYRMSFSENRFPLFRDML